VTDATMTIMLNQSATTEDKTQSQRKITAACK